VTGRHRNQMTFSPEDCTEDNVIVLNLFLQ